MKSIPMKSIQVKKSIRMKKRIKYTNKKYTNEKSIRMKIIWTGYSIE